MRTRFAIVFILLLSAGAFMHLHSDVAVPVNRPFAEFPRVKEGWRVTAEATFSDRVLEVLRPTDYISRRYTAPDGKDVELYIGYHGGGKDSGQIHSPKQCLPGSGWHRVSEVKEAITVGEKKINLVKAVYTRGESREMFIYWFQVKDRTIDDEYSLKVAEIVNSMAYNRRDSAFVRVSVPFEEDDKKAFATGMRFIKDFYPVIDEFLPG